MPKPPSSPVGTKIGCIGWADGPWNHADGPTLRTDVKSVETDRKQLKTRAEMSVNGRGGPGHKTHLVGSRSKHQSIPDNENTSATMGMSDTHRETHRSNPRTRETERSSLDEGKGCQEDLRTLRQPFRMETARAETGVEMAGAGTGVETAGAENDG